MFKHPLTPWISALAVTVSLCIPAAAETVTVSVTDRVLVRDTVRLGINLCSDNYWDCAMLKMRAAENFEGLRYRMMTWGPQMDENGIYVWFRPTDDPAVWAKMKGVVRYTILTGPEKARAALSRISASRSAPPTARTQALLHRVRPEVQPLQQNQIGIMLELTVRTRAAFATTATRRIGTRLAIPPTSAMCRPIPSAMPHSG